jgi:hypothetical protein
MFIRPVFRLVRDNTKIQFMRGRIAGRGFRNPSMLPW